MQILTGVGGFAVDIGLKGSIEEGNFSIFPYFLWISLIVQMFY